MGPVRGLSVGAIWAMAAGPAMAEVCDKAPPVYANPVYWVLALLFGLALGRGGRRLLTAAIVVTLLIGALDTWGYVTEDESLRSMTESAILEGCRLPMTANILLYLALVALLLLRFRWRAL